MAIELDDDIDFGRIKQDVDAAMRKLTEQARKHATRAKGDAGVWRCVDGQMVRVDDEGVSDE